MEHAALHSNKTLRKRGAGWRRERGQGRGEKKKKGDMVKYGKNRNEKTGEERGSDEMMKYD